MLRRFAKNWLLGLAALAAGADARADDAWQQPEHLRGSNVRIFLSDGTPPAVSKGRIAKRIAEPAADPVMPVAHVSPMVRLSNIPWPKMPHGFQDPTHPVGPAEPGSAAPRFYGPVSSGYTLPARR